MKTAVFAVEFFTAETRRREGGAESKSMLKKNLGFPPRTFAPACRSLSAGRSLRLCGRNNLVSTVPIQFK